MSKKKEKLDEGMVMMASLLPVGGGVHGLGGFRTKEDNFEFKGFPGQFDKDGNKIMDIEGNDIKEVVELNETLSKKSYIVIANVIKNSRNVRDVVFQLADAFAKNNSQFNKERFITACGE